MLFQITALPEEYFKPFFSMSDEELSQHNGKRMLVNCQPGYPCRVSLQDAEVGETVILINHHHQTEGGPYKASHAIFVREGQKQAHPASGVVPESIKLRLISLRAFDDDHNMRDADVAKGDDIEVKLLRMFENTAISYVHLHNAKPGCFAAKAVRA